MFRSSRTLTCAFSTCRARFFTTGRSLRQVSSATAADAAQSRTPSQELVTLREIDRLLTRMASASSSESSHPSPLLMKDNRPWLSPPSTFTKSAKTDMQKFEDLLAEPRRMADSFTTFELPVTSDPALFERYVNTSGGFRMGKLLEHLDSLAGAVSYRHCLPPALISAATSSKPTDDQGNAALPLLEASSKAGLYLATASADRIDMFGSLDKEHVQDLRFTGFVAYTGRSSMEVFVKMEGLANGPGKEETLMLGRFSMVARDAQTHKAKKIAQLAIETDDEKELWAIGEGHKRRKREGSLVALDKVPPSSEEAKEVHTLMLQTADPAVVEIAGEEVVKMHETEISSVTLMHPQDRNLHGKVFGGRLMAMAYELAFTNCCIFAKEPLRFLSLDQITFRLPVPIGAVLRLTSKIVKTSRPDEGEDLAKCHVMVKAEVEDYSSGERKETNTFSFTLAKHDKTPLGRTVVPESYLDAMNWLEGKRRLDVGGSMRKLYQNKAT